jgi:seryl-tRNA synthetase
MADAIREEYTRIVHTLRRTDGVDMQHIGPMTPGAPSSPTETIQALEAAKRDLSTRNVSLAAENDTLKAKIEVQTSIINAGRKQVADLEQAINDNQDASAHLTALNTQLKAENTQYQQNLIAAQAAIDALQQELQHLKDSFVPAVQEVQNSAAQHLIGRDRATINGFFTLVLPTFYRHLFAALTDVTKNIFTGDISSQLKTLDLSLANALEELSILNTT